MIEVGMHLMPEDRVEVAETLLGSVPEAIILGAWIDEASRRSNERNAGSVKGIEVNEAIRQLKKNNVVTPIVHPAALEELLRAGRYYVKVSERVAQRFRAEVEKGLSEIGRNPEQTCPH